jgi:DNA-binding transcriptional regulator GbsR (MarR family)
MAIDNHLPPLSRAVRFALRRDGQPLGHQPHVGQIYALIFISQRALNADDIAEAWSSRAPT